MCGYNNNTLTSINRWDLESRFWQGCHQKSRRDPSFYKTTSECSPSHGVVLFVLLCFRRFLAVPFWLYKFLNQRFELVLADPFGFGVGYSTFWPASRSTCVMDDELEQISSVCSLSSWSSSSSSSIIKLAMTPTKPVTEKPELMTSWIASRKP